MQPEEGSITVAVAAKLLKITPRRVQQLVSEQWIEKGAKRGSYPLVSVVQGYIAFLKDENTRSTKAAAASRVTEARTREIELRIAEKDKSLIPLGDAQDTFDAITGDYLASVSGLPARITRQPRERQRIEKICDQERKRLTKAFGKTASDTIPPRRTTGAG